MSAGLHRAWKDALVSALRPPQARPFRHLDVAGGTGDSPSAFSTRAGRRRTSPCSTSTATCCGSGASERGARRCRAASTSSRPTPRHCRFADADLRRLHDRLRHSQRAAHRARRSRKRYRVLKPRRPLPVSRILQGRRAGPRRDLRCLFVQRDPAPRPRWSTGDAESYRYLVESIRRFPTAARPSRG